MEQSRPETPDPSLSFERLALDDQYHYHRARASYAAESAVVPPLHGEQPGSTFGPYLFDFAVPPSASGDRIHDKGTGWIGLAYVALLRLRRI